MREESEGTSVSVATRTSAARDSATYARSVSRVLDLVMSATFHVTMLIVLAGLEVSGGRLQ